jgi:hypothetical protein
VSEQTLFTSVLWCCRWRLPHPQDPDGYHTAYVAAPSPSAAARIVQEQIAASLGEHPTQWPNVELSPEGDVTWEAP